MTQFQRLLRKRVCDVTSLLPPAASHNDAHRLQRQGRGLRAARFLDARDRAGGDCEHRMRRSDAQERRAYSRATQGDRHHNNASDIIRTHARRGLTVLAAAERLAEARCGRDDVTARSRS
jgi:hypothetical protein